MCDENNKIVVIILDNIGWIVFKVGEWVIVGVIFIKFDLGFFYVGKLKSNNGNVIVFIVFIVFLIFFILKF